MVAVFAALLLCFVSLSVDVGYIYVGRAEMQRAVDSAALAGASGLQGGERTVNARAADLAGRHTVFNQAVVSEELEIELGYWNGVTRTFVARTQTPTAVSPNAVLVAGTRLGTDLFFASIMGYNTTDVRRHAVAVMAGGHCAGVWGLDGIAASGALVTDSYDSTAGPYGGSNAYANGDLCSCRDINVNGNVEINGDAMYGTGYNFIPRGRAYDVYGVITDHNCTVPSYEPDFINARDQNDNASIGLTRRGRDPFNGTPWDLHLNGNDTLTLSGGTYYFTSVWIAGNAKITINGPTQIYVDGPGFFTGGGVVNSGGNPHDLIVYSSGNDLMFTGGSDFYGAIVAPDSDVFLTGGMDAYGTIIAGYLDINGSTKIHVDESLVEDLFEEKVIVPALVE